MKKSNWYIGIPGLIIFFIGLAIQQSFCFSDTFCVESQPVGIALMVVGGGLFVVWLAKLVGWLRL